MSDTLPISNILHSKTLKYKICIRHTLFRSMALVRELNLVRHRQPLLYSAVGVDCPPKQTFPLTMNGDFDDAQ